MKICSEHIRVSKGAFQFLMVNSSIVKLTSKSNYSLLSSFVVQFERSSVRSSKLISVANLNMVSMAQLKEHLSCLMRQQHDRSCTWPPPMLVCKYVEEWLDCHPAVKRSCNLKILLHTGNKGDLHWLWNPEQKMSHREKVQNKDISDPTERTYVLQNYLRI